MKFNITFKKRLFISITLIFAIYLVASLFIEQYKERTLKREALIEQLEIFSDIVSKSIQETNNTNLNNITSLFPSKLRLSIINSDGTVIYDNNVNTSSNHSHRPEIEKANIEGKSYDIRTSESNQQEYIYFAKKYKDLYIRTALPYDIDTIQILKPDSFSSILLSFYLLLYLS